MKPPTKALYIVESKSDDAGEEDNKGMAGDMIISDNSQLVDHNNSYFLELSLVPIN